MPIEAATTGVGSTNPTLAFNLASVTDWSTALPFIDLMHMARPWMGHLPGQWGGMSFEALRDGGYLDQNGWVREIPPGVQSVGSYWAPQPESEDRRGTFVMTWEGEGTIQLEGNVTIISQTPGRIVFSNPNGRDFLFRITSTDPNNTDNYIRNISVVHESHVALHEAGALFNPDWLELIGDARQLRFMDWMETNGSHISAWNQMPSADHYSFFGLVPVEVMVRLANEVGADPWFNIPHLASDDFVRQFAQYVRDNLDPNLTARVEYSNELWNNAFPQTQWLSQQSQALWGVNAPVDYHAMRATQVAVIWEQVFAQAQGPAPDLANVLGAFSHGSWYGNNLLNPTVWQQRDPGGYTPPAQHFEELAITNYFGTGVVLDQAIRTDLLNRIAASPTDAAAWLAQRLMDPNFYTSIPSDQVYWAQNANVAHQYGLDLVAYEGGQHLHHSFAVSGLTEQQISTLTTFLGNFVRSPAMGTLYQHHWNAWAAVSDGPMMHFQDVGSVSQWGSWGLLSHLDDSTPRSAALLELARTSQPWWDAVPTSSFQHGVQRVGTAAADQLAGTAQEDYLAGQDGNDELAGGGGSDGLSGGAGNDILGGGDGADLLRGGTGTDTLTGGTGADTFSGSAAELNGDTIADFQAGDRILVTNANPGGFTFSLSGNTLTYTGGSLTLSTVPTGAIVAGAAPGGGVQLTVGTGTPPPTPPAPPPPPGAINGTSGNDTLNGTSGANTIYGHAGADVLSGGQGADILIGGDGNDTISSDRPIGFDGNVDVDVINAGAGNDMIFAGYGDVVDGGAGFDTLNLSYIGASHGIVGDTNVLFRGLPLSPGGGTVANIERFDAVALSQFNDQMVVGDQADPATAYGYGGDDHLIGQENRVVFYGGEGNDLIVGSTANDVLYGENGSDILIGHLGPDELWGGAGNDRFLYAQVGATDTIGDFVSGTDKIDLTGIDANSAAAGNQAFSFIGSAAFSGSAGELRVYNGGTSGNVVAVDVNGDRVADLMINLGSASAVSTDFLL